MANYCPRNDRKIVKFIFLYIILHLFFLAQNSLAAELVITSRYVKKATLDPMSKAWDKTKGVSIPLIKQNLVAPHGGGAVKEVEVMSLWTDREIFVKLVWTDETKDTKFSLTEKFSDACAVEMPLNNSSFPSFIMGEKDNPVNIWVWHAIGDEEDKMGFPPAYSDYYRKDAMHAVLKFKPAVVENLIAEGFGTITSLEIQDIEGKGVWVNGKWHIVMKRTFESSSGAGIKKDTNIPMAFAVWDGGSGERGGEKSVSPWHLLKVGNAPQVEEPKDEIGVGRKVYMRYGCVTCHGKDGKEPRENLNAKGGKAPALAYVAEGFTANELKDRISKGRSPEKDSPGGPYPPLRMNAWGAVMDETELDSIVKYLMSLMPQTEKW
jgi:mono/diheme cytochrome c family protein